MGAEIFQIARQQFKYYCLFMAIALAVGVLIGWGSRGFFVARSIEKTTTLTIEDRVYRCRADFRLGVDQVYPWVKK